MKSEKQILELINVEILLASDEIKALQKPNDGTEEAYFNGYILAMSKAKKIIKNAN